MRIIINIGDTKILVQPIEFFSSCVQPILKGCRNIS